MKPSTYIGLRWKGAGEPLRTGFQAFLILAIGRLVWNLAHPGEMFLDSWVLVHIQQVLAGGSELLPRALLTWHYPLVYLPYWPFAAGWGAHAAVKLLYPAVAALAAIPAALLIGSVPGRGPLPILGALALVLVPDLAVKGMQGTPQAAALPLFFLAFYFALRQQRLGFALTATAVLLTHHLTGLVTMVLYYTVVALPRSRSAGFLAAEWPCLLWFGLWPVYWAWTFAATQQLYLGPVFMTLVLLIGLPVSLLLYLAAPLANRAVHWAGGRVDRLSPLAVSLLAGAAACTGWLASGSLISSPGLAAAPLASRSVIAIYALLLLAGALAALAARSLPLVLFPFCLLALAGLTVIQGCSPLFDGLRLVDYALIGGLVALFGGPGARARWAGTPLLLCVVAAVLLAASIRLTSGRDRLFTYSEGEITAARWAVGAIPPGASVATDAKLSLLLLGEAGRNATYEGTWWLFDEGPIAPYIFRLNQGERFRSRPIRYVMVSGYMFRTGAEVSWFAPPMVAPGSLPVRLDAIGTQVYQSGDVTVWELAPDLVASAAAAHPEPVSFVRRSSAPPSAGLLRRVCQ